DPYGNTVWGPQGIGDMGPTALTASGRYTLIVDSWPGSSADATYRFIPYRVQDATQALTGIGQTVTGSIVSPGQKQRYTFSLAQDQRLFFDSLTRNGSIRWSLTGPKGVVASDLAFEYSDWAYGPGALDLVAGDYTLTIVGDGATLGDFSFRLLDLAQATVIATGAAVSGSRAPGSSADAYAFDVATPGRYFFDTTANDDGNTRWRLIDPYGRAVWGSDGFSDRALALDVVGRYTLLVEGWSGTSGTSTYGFTIQQVVNGRQSLALGETVSGRVAQQGQTQAYTFDLAADARLLMDSLTQASNLRWSLDGPGGLLVDSRAFSDSDWYSGVDALNLAAGRYTLRVFGNGDAVGDFAFRLLDLASAQALTLGSTVEAVRTAPNQAAMYAFDGVAGQSYFFDALASSSGNVAWRLYGPDGRRVWGPTGFSDVDTTRLSATGRYTLVLEERADASAATTQRFAVHAVQDGSQAMTVGATVSGNLTQPGQRQVHSFSLSAAGAFVFDSLTSRGDIRWSLEGPTPVSQRTFLSSDAGNIGGSTRLALAPGDYRLVVDGDGDAAGGYAFRLLDLSSAPTVALDTDTTVTLDPANGTALLAFDAQAGDQITLDRLSLSPNNADLRWRLYGPAGVLVMGPEGFNDRNLSLATGGRYTLLLEGQPAQSGTTTLGLAVRRTAQTPPEALTGTAFGLGDTVTGSITAVNGTTDHLFTLTAPTRVLLDGLSTGSAFRWRLDGPRGEEVALTPLYADSYDGGARAAIDLPAGTYRLRMSAVSGITGDYAFRLLDLGQATALTLGQSTPVTLDPANGTKVLAFDAQAGQRYFFDATDGSGGDTYWRLLDPQGQPVWGPAWRGSDQSVVLSQTGRYTLLVEGRYYVTGSASMSFAVHAVADATEAMTVGSTVSGSLTQPGQKRSHTFELAEAGRFLFDSLANQGSLRWTLTGPQGTVASSVAFSGSDWYSGPGVLNLPAGAYTLTVQGDGDAAGAYSFRLLDLSSAQALTPGTPVQGSRTPGAKADLYRFDAAAGSTWFFDVTANNDGNTNWRLLDPQGRVVVGPGGLGDYGPFTLSQAGRYTLVVESWPGTTGTSTYGFRLNAQQIGRQAIALGSRFDATIGQAGDRQVFTFSLTEARSVYVDLLAYADNLVWSLKGPQGLLVDQRRLYSTDSADGLSLLVLPPGDYEFTVQGAGEGTGTAAFRLLDLAQARPLTPGTAVSGTLDPATQTQMYRFTAQAGERFFFDAISASGGDSRWRLLDPWGRQVWISGLSDVAAMDLAYAGTYTLLVEGRYYVSGTAGYQVNVQPAPRSQDVPISVGGEPAAPGPDLVVRNLVVTPEGGTLQSGGRVTVSWDVLNDGDQPATGLWQDRLIVRNLDRNAAVTNVLVDYADLGANPAALQPGQTRSRSVTLTLPPGNAGAGNLRFELATDVANAVEEAGGASRGEANNQLTQTAVSQLVAYPDLQVRGLAVEPAGAFAAGASVTVRWKVANTGDGAAAAGWTDRLQLRDLDTGAVLLLRDVAHTLAADGPLAAGAERDRSATFNWPAGAAGLGRFEFSVVTDVSDAVFENNADGNAGANNGATLAITSSVDLSVQDLAVAPAAPGSGDTVTVRWTERNGGAAATAGSWNDRLIVRNLDTGETLVNTAVTYDPTLPGNAPLAAGGSLARQSSFTLPSGVRGAGRIQVQVIADSAVNGAETFREYNAAGDYAEGNNGATLQFTAQLRNYADLRVESWTAPDSGRGGNTISVSWTVANRGGADATGGWADQIVLSTDAILGNADDRVLATVSRATGLAVGQSYVETRDITLPLLQGNVSLFVRTDSGNVLAEPDTRADNQAVRSLALTSPAPDLVVELVSAPATASSGQPVEVSWRVRNQGETPATGTWKDAVYLSSDDRLDAGDVLLGSFVRSGPLAAGQNYSVRQQVGLPFELTGNYRLLVVTDAEDTVVEQGGGNNATAALAATTLTPTPSPDLAVSAVRVADTAPVGSAVTVTWTLANTGEATASGPWVDRVYLSSDGSLNGAQLLGTLNHSTALAAGAQMDFSLDVALPLRADGALRIVVVSDAAGQVYEGRREANNSADAPIALTHRDLIVSALDVPATARSGDVVRVTREVRNAGSAPVSGAWVDRYYLSRDAVLGAGDVLLGESTQSRSLAPGEAYTDALDLTLPLELSGDWFLIAVADAGNAVAEFNAEDNNTRASAVAITLAPYADLVVSGVTAPTQIIGDPGRITVGWTVTNQGTGPGRISHWVDSVVAVDTITGAEIVLGRYDHDGALAVGTSYQRSETIFLPAGTSGRYRVEVRADSTAQVFENGAEANNTAAAPAPMDAMPKPYADLQVTALDLPADARSGQLLQATWTVANQGIGRTDTEDWTDLLFLSTDAEGRNRIATAAVDHLGVLAAGGDYQRSASVRVPDGYSGPVYVGVQTGGAYEFIFGGNNTRIAGPVQVALAPAPDLVVTTVGAPTAAVEGDTIAVRWVVANQGEARAEGGWRDVVLLRKLGDANASPIILGSFDYADGLDAGKQYERTERFRLPSRIEGAWQVVVGTDAAAAVYEGVFGGARETNNATSAQDALTLSLKPRPDLQVQTIEAPDRVSAGATAGVSFVVVNRGSVATDTPRWKDNVYLSVDDKPGADDILIGSLDNGSALDPTGSYRTTTANIVIPERFRGQGYILVIADASGSVDEYPNANEANNYAVRAIYVEPKPQADLLVGRVVDGQIQSSVVAPAQAVYGGEIEVRFTVTNRGSAVTNKPQWSDSVWLTTDKTRPNPGGNGGVLLGTVAHTGALAVGESYDVVMKVRIPQQIASGTYYITPWTDAFDAVIEDTLAININNDDPEEADSNNYKARAIDIIGTPVPPLPDLRVTEVTTSATATQPGSVDAPFTVSWTVQNFAEGAAAGDWYDTVFVHDTPNLGDPGAKIWTLGTFQRPGELLSLEKYTQTKQFDLSPAVKGRYVTVVSDVGYPYPSLAESNETNNSRTVAAEVVARPADLKVVAVTAPAQNFSGEKTTVSWTVRNDGAAVWSGTRLWADTVWISAYPTFSLVTSTRLGATVHSATGGLGAGQSYTASAEVQLPAGIGGDYFIYVVVDDPDYRGTLVPDGDSGSNEDSRNYFGIRAFEGAGGTNNLGRGDIPVTYREPDLRISALQLPSGELRSGQTVNVSFTVANQGTRDTRQQYWVDRLYLSRDASLDPNDLQVAEFSRYGALAAGQSYERAASFVLPGDADGPFYLIAFSDASVRGVVGEGTASPVQVGQVRLGQDAVPEFRDEGNNAMVVPITVKLSPAADLQVTAVGSPQERVRTGQSLTVNYTVGNLGGAATPSGDVEWEDRIYLSADEFFDPNADRYLGSVSHRGVLPPNGSYDVSTTLRLPRELLGSYYIFVQTDVPRGGSEPRGKVFESTKENNNLRASATPVLIELPPPSDLVVDDITVDGGLTSGEKAAIRFTIKNDSLVDAQGSWSDSVYLSADGVWDLGDVLLGRVAHNGGLAAGASYQALLDAVVPPAKAGQYRIIVRPDIYDEVYEGVDERNNVRASADPITVTVPELRLGVPLSTTLSPGEQKLYRIVVGANETLQFALDSADALSANELYVRYGDVASGFAFDVGAQDVLSASPRALVPSTQAGEYYVLIQGRSGSLAKAPVTLTAKALPFQITDIAQDQGGDSRWVTATITGARFQPGALVKLVRPGISEVEPARYEVIDATKIVATFDLTG
ncbi:CARDB domain-containing protein, partial [uncultured Pseudacidovorax sp.]|uniref:CARDB domain-containing protein n=1 Tax=uncultured Pseudacidovorax sp. TaxID=679313 RepID=UPI0025DC781D